MKKKEREKPTGSLASRFISRDMYVYVCIYIHTYIYIYMYVHVLRRAKQHVRASAHRRVSKERARTRAVKKQKKKETRERNPRTLFVARRGYYDRSGEITARDTTSLYDDDTIVRRRRVRLKHSSRSPGTTVRESINPRPRAGVVFLV